MCQLSTKICTLCGESKSLDSFHRDSRNKSGFTARCASCRTKKQIEYQNTQKQTKPDHYTRWRKSNNYSSKYGLSLVEIEEKLKEQGFVCPICERSLELNSWVVDHNHSTGKVRDILCSSCNKGLGFFYESPKALQSAINYLEKHNDSLS